MLSTPPNMQQTKRHDPMASETKEKAQNNGFFNKFSFEQQIRGKSRENPPKNQPKSIAASLMHSINEAEKARIANNADCILVINQMINQPELVKTFRQMVASDPANTPAKYAIGLQALLDQFDAGETLALVKTCEAIAKQHDQLGRQFLTEKVKPIVMAMNVLIQCSDNSFRWATLAELERSAPGKPSLIKNLKSATTSKLGELKAKVIINRRKVSANPYLLVDDNGNVEQLRKPFTGELTKEEAKLMREYDDAKAKADLIEKTRKLKDKAAGKEQHQQNRELEVQQQSLWAQAQLDITELQIRKAYEAEKWKTFQKPAIVIGVIVLVGLAITNLDKLPQGQTMQANIQSVPVPSYQAPTWEVKQ